MYVSFSHKVIYWENLKLKCLTMHQVWTWHHTVEYYNLFPIFNTNNFCNTNNTHILAPFDVRKVAIWSKPLRLDDTLFVHHENSKRRLPRFKSKKLHRTEHLCNLHTTPNQIIWLVMGHFKRFSRGYLKRQHGLLTESNNNKIYPVVYTWNVLGMQHVVIKLLNSLWRSSDTTEAFQTGRVFPIQ